MNTTIEMIEKAIAPEGQNWSGSAANFSLNLRKTWLARGNRRQGKVYWYLRNKICTISGVETGNDWPTINGLANLIDDSPRREDWISCLMEQVREE